MDVFPWPESDVAGRLIEQFTNDPTGTADFFAAYLTPLIANLQARHAGEDPHLIQDVVADLLLAFPKNPELYDPARLPLHAYLMMAAQGDLKNAQQKRQRRQGRARALDFVAEPEDDGNNPAAIDEDVRDWLVDPVVAATIAKFTPPEQAVWALMLEGIRDTAAYAVCLDLVDRPRGEQEAEVKRVKDRIKTRLQRAAGVRA